MVSLKPSFLGKLERQFKISQFGILTKVIENQMTSIKTTEIRHF